MEKTTLRELREENKKTAAEVAAALGVSKEAIYKYETGARKISIEQVIKLSEFYNESAEDIIRAQLNSYLTFRE